MGQNQLTCPVGCFSGTFLPQEEKVKENEEWRGILLYASGQEDSLNVIPVVRYGGNVLTQLSTCSSHYASRRIWEC